MTMTRKDFREVAYALWSARLENRFEYDPKMEVTQDDIIYDIVSVIGPALKRCNPNFQYDKFHNAVFGDKMP